MDSVPVTDEEAQNICETDEIPERISQYMRLGMSDSEEEIRNEQPFGRKWSGTKNGERVGGET